MPGVLFVVVGTGMEAHMLTSLTPGSTEKLLFLLPEEPPRQGDLASSIVTGAAGFKGVEEVVVLSGGSARAIGIDVPFEARIAERRMELAVKAVEISPEKKDGWGMLSTELEDRVISAVVETCPKGVTGLPAHPGKNKSRLSTLIGKTTHEEGFPGSPVVLLGTDEAACEELARDLRRLGVGVAGCVPEKHPESLPDLNEGSVVAPVEPFLGDSCRVAEERGARVVRTLFPVGINGTARFLQDVASEAGAELAVSESLRPRREGEETEELKNRLRGCRVFFTGETGLEIPLGRLLAGAGALAVEVGVPRLDRWMLGEELRTLGSDIDVVETPDWRSQLERIDKASPDLVVTSPSRHGPLVARGHVCRLSDDFLSANPYGYGGSRRVLELVAGSLERAERLDALRP
jgi:light-independent protochlorophyllide reductase subunit N